VHESSRFVTTER